MLSGTKCYFRGTTQIDPNPLVRLRYPLFAYNGRHPGHATEIRSSSATSVASAIPSFALQLPGVIPTKSQQMTLSVGDVTP